MKKVYHYTSGNKMPIILADGELKTSILERQRGEKHPGLWFSANELWEHTATKRVVRPGISAGPQRLTMQLQHELVGCYRFAVEFDPTIMITWAKFRHVSGFHIEELNEMEHKGEMWGAKKEEWFCCFQNMPKEKWLSIEKWNGTNWEPYQQ